MKSCAITIALLCFLVNAHAQFPFFDGFESGNLTAGQWNVSGNAQVSTSFPAHGNYCLEGPATWGINRTFNTSFTGLLTVEFSARASQENTSCMIFRIKDLPGNTATGMFFDEFGFINVSDSSGPGSVIPVLQYTIEKWYAFRFEIDFSGFRYDLYIDNTLVANDYRFYSVHFVSPYLFTWSSIATSGTAWLDDVYIYQGTVDVGNSLKDVPFESHFDASSSVFQLITTDSPIESVQLFNSSGQLLNEQKLNDYQFHLSLVDLPKGWYFFNIIIKGREFKEVLIR